jgi:hypothetical protein
VILRDLERLEELRKKFVWNKDYGEYVNLLIQHAPDLIAIAKGITPKGWARRPQRPLHEIVGCDEAKLVELLEQLSDRDQVVLRMYYGVDEQTFSTFEEIGERYAVSRTRAKQLVDRALQRLAALDGNPNGS